MTITIGLDIGTSGTKGIAIDPEGRVLASALAEYPLHSPKPNWAEQDPADWKRAAFDVLGRLATQIDAASVKAISLTGQMHGSVFLDRKHEVIRPALLWCDQRTAAECDEITTRIGAERLIDMVCNPALTGFTAPKILWLRKTESAHYARVEKVLLPKDYVRYVLSGEMATDVADASGTLLFDVAQRTWHAKLMNDLDIPESFMPRAYEGPEITGALTNDAAKLTGLRAGTPIVAGGGDQAAGGVGCGVVNEGVVSMSLGTSGVVFAYASEVSRDTHGRVHTFCHSVPGAWHVMGVMLSAGGSLRWFRDALCRPEKAVAAETGRDAYEYITDAAATIPIGAEGLTFLPYLTGERTPHKDPYAKGAFVGLSLRHTRAHMARAVLEGVTFGMRDSLEIMRGMGIPVGEIRASGGGARSPFWRQMFADVSGAPIVTLNVDEGPAFGAALLAMVAAGEHPSVQEACAATIRVTQRIDPDRASAEKYEDWYGVYRAMYPALSAQFKTAATLLDKS